MAEIVTCGTVLQDRSLFQGIKLLPAGSDGCFISGGAVQKDKYFDSARWERQPLISPSEFDQRLQETFAQILPRYLHGRNRVGMSLTGGLDGRMIMSWAKLPSGNLPCYSFASHFRDCIDVRLARRIAAACDQPHTTIVVGDSFLSEFPQYAEKAIYVSDGAMDVTGAVELYVNNRRAALPLSD